MAVTTFTPIYKWADKNTGNFRLIGVLTGPSSYPNTGGTIGIPLPTSLFNINAFADTSDAQQQVAPAFGPISVMTDGVILWSGFIDAVTGNLRLIVNTTGLEVANTTDVSTYKTLLQILGR